MKSFFSYCKEHLSSQAIVFILAFSGYIYLGLCITYPAMFNWHDGSFGADNVRVFGDLTKIVSDHYRIKVHPLFLLAAQPITLCLNGIVNYSPMAVIIFESFCGAMAVSLFYAILKQRRVREGLRIVFTIIYGCSFSTMIFSAVPESFIFAALSLVSFWYFITIAMDAEGPLSAREIFLLVFWGTLCFGITLTNYVSYVMGLCCLLSSRYKGKNGWIKFLQVNVWNAISVAVLCLYQKFVWKDGPLFWDSMIGGLRGQEYEETRYMNWSINFEKTINWAKQVLLYPILSPDVTVQESGDVQIIQFGGYPDIVHKGILVLFFLSVLYCFCIKLRHRDKGNRYLLWMFAAWIGNLALHYIYGNQEAFLYSPHFIFLFLVIAAISANEAGEGKANKPILAVFVLFCVLEAVNNLKYFFKTVDLMMDFTGSVYYPVHSVKGAVLCGGIASAIYFYRKYQGWSSTKGLKTVPKETATELKIRGCSKAALGYAVFVLVTGLFIAFNYTMF